MLVCVAQEMRIEYYYKTAVALSNGYATSGVKRPLAAELDNPP